MAVCRSEDEDEAQKNFITVNLSGAIAEHWGDLALPPAKF